MTGFQKPPPGMGKPKGGCGATLLLAAVSLPGMFIRNPDRLKQAWEETR